MLKEPTESETKEDAKPGQTTQLQLLLAWAFVGVPLTWGVLETIRNALSLFH